MKRSVLLERLVSIAATVSMVLAVGASSFAADAGQCIGNLTVDTAVSGNFNCLAVDYYSFTPTISGPYMLEVTRTTSSHTAEVLVDDETSFTDPTSVQSTGGTTGKTIDLVAGTTYYFLPHRFTTGSTQHPENTVGISLVLKYDFNVVTLSFDANGGEGTMDSVDLRESYAGTIPANAFTYSGYTFIGWDEDSSATTATYADGASITISADTTLYAIWEEDPTPGPEPGPAPAPSGSETPGPTPEEIREMSINNFVENLYLVALNRTYDTTGRTYWIDKLMNKGYSGSQIVLGFLNSPEFLSKNLSNEEYVTVLYRIYLDRAPDAAGFDSWVAMLENGTSRNDVANGFAGSTEWAAFCARYAVNP